MVVSAEGAARCDVPASANRGGVPWRLRMPSWQATVAIDGVTRWDAGEASENLSLWSTNPSSWFDFHGNRWLLTPYSRAVYAEADARSAVTFSLHNNGPEVKRISLALEFDGAPWPAKLSANNVSLAPGESSDVTLTCEASPTGGERRCYVRATASGGTGFSTWSSVTVRSGTAPAERPLALPLKLEPYRHENEQFGYLPAYPVDNQVYFDPANRPYVVAVDGIFSMRGNNWIKTTEARHGGTGAAVPIRTVVTKMAFDRDGDAYTIGSAGGSPVLLHSRDDGATFTAWPIPGSGSFDIEQFSGHNIPDGPPPLARFHRTAKDPNLIWRSLNDFDIFLPVKRSDGAIVIGEPVPVSRKCIGLSVHSGIPSTIVSRNGKVHVTWGEATDPEENAPGVPTFAATIDRASRRMSEPFLVGYGPPANDIHNTPCITIDGDGYIHILIGTHGRTFKYVRSLASNDAGGGWTEAEDIGPGLLQTYVGMVTGPDNALHVVFRLWRNDDKYFPAGSYGTLGYMKKPSGGQWSEPTVLVVAPFSEYSIFYHRLTIDRTGSLFLSYDYWSTFWFYRTDHRGRRRALMMSPDGGANWRMTPSNAFSMR
jgi:hypothetical protein